MTHTFGWTIIILRVANKEMQKQPATVRTKFEQLLDVVRRNGFGDIPSKRIKKLTDDVWELRVWGDKTTTRALYLKRDGRRVIIARVYTKKKQKTDDHEIKLALQRVKEYDHTQ